MSSALSVVLLTLHRFAIIRRHVVSYHKLFILIDANLSSKCEVSFFQCVAFLLIQTLVLFLIRSLYKNVMQAFPFEELMAAMEESN